MVKIQRCDAFKEQSALVLIDWQQGILDANSQPMKHDVHQTVVQLVRDFQQQQRPVVFVTVFPEGPWITTDKEIPATSQHLPSNFTELHPDLHPVENDILIRKHQWTAFYQTPLDTLLRQRGIQTIYFAGTSTSIGVEGSARDASVLGYTLLFVENALLDRDLSCHQHSIQHIFPRLGRVVTYDPVSTR